MTGIIIACPLWITIRQKFIYLFVYLFINNNFICKSIQSEHHRKGAATEELMPK